MRKGKRAAGLGCLVLGILMLMQGCIQISDTPPTETTEKPEEGYIYPTVQYEYRTDITPMLSDILTGMDPAYLLLANKKHPLGSDFRPDSTVKLTCPTYGGKTVFLEPRTARALYAMYAEMQADGIGDVYVTSGYRSYQYQQQLFEKYLDNEQRTISSEAKAYFGDAYIRSHYTDQGKTGLSEEDAKKVVLSYSAYPGTSEHQTGLCLDFIGTNGKLDQSFENTEAFRWLYENAYRFGFILRYPDGKENLTGYFYEPWHYRFVGREAATEIAYRSITLEEFLKKT